jgi:hypothetical protein
VVLRQLLDERSPHVARLRETMQQDNGIAFAGHEVVDPNSVDFSELALRRLRERCAQQTGCAQH